MCVSAEHKTKIRNLTAIIKKFSEDKITKITSKLDLDYDLLPDLVRIHIETEVKAPNRYHLTLNLNSKSSVTLIRDSYKYSPNSFPLMLFPEYFLRARVDKNFLKVYKFLDSSEVDLLEV